MQKFRYEGGLITKLRPEEEPVGKVIGSGYGIYETVVGIPGFHLEHAN